MIYIKAIKVGDDIIIAACDREVLGKKFSDGRFHLHVKEDFYKGDLKPLEELDRLIRNATIVNLSGNRAVDRAIKMGFVDEDCTLEISGIKHAQIISIF